MIVPVTIERIGTSPRGDRWRVLHDGIVIVENSRDPEHDAARALAALGLRGTIETRHAGSDIVSMRLDIAKAAGRTVIENENTGPRFGRWRAFDLTQRTRGPVAVFASERAQAFEVAPLPE